MNGNNLRITSLLIGFLASGTIYFDFYLGLILFACAGLLVVLSEIFARLDKIIEGQNTVKQNGVALTETPY